VWKRGVHNLLHIENKKRYSMAQAENVETVIRWRGVEGKEKDICLLCAEEGNELLKCPKTQRWRQKLPKNKWLHIGEVIAPKNGMSTMSLNREIWVPTHTRLNVN